MVETTPLRPSIRLGESVIMLGSCFTNHIGERMRKGKFRCSVNPFGELYNPSSIANALSCVLDFVENKKTITEQYLFSTGEGWFSWLHSDLVWENNKDKLLYRLNDELAKEATLLAEADTLILTLGTSRCYELKPEGWVVSNCHKQPQARFVVKDLTIDDIVVEMSKLIERLTALRPQIKIIFTVSPYRYTSYGFHTNQLAKATLFMAIDALQKRFPQVCLYFPSYEILMDELRDYRFYASDMLHPSEQAADYIWEHFVKTCMDEKAQAFLSELQRLTKALNHRLLHPGSSAGTAFLDQLAVDIEEMSCKYPDFSFDEELKQLENKRVNK